jgi:hypothetical protein
MWTEAFGRLPWAVNGLSRDNGGIKWSRESLGLVFEATGVTTSFDNEDRS